MLVRCSCVNVVLPDEAGIKIDHVVAYDPDCQYVPHMIEAVMELESV